MYVVHLPHTDESGCNESLIGIEVSGVSAGTRDTIKAGNDKLLSILQGDKALNPPARLMQQSDMRIIGDGDVFAGGRREDGSAPAPSAICKFAQGHRFAKVEGVASRAGLLFKLVDMAFIDVRLLHRVERLLVPYETAKVVSNAVDVAGDMCDDMLDNCHQQWPHHLRAYQGQARPLHQCRLPCEGHGQQCMRTGAG